MYLSVHGHATRPSRLQRAGRSPRGPCPTPAAGPRWGPGGRHVPPPAPRGRNVPRAARALGLRGAGPGGCHVRPPGRAPPSGGWCGGARLAPRTPHPHTRQWLWGLRGDKGQRKGREKLIFISAPLSSRRGREVFLAGGIPEGRFVSAEVPGSALLPPLPKREGRAFALPIFKGYRQLAF